MKKVFFIVIMSLSLICFADFTYAKTDKQVLPPISFQIEIQDWEAVNKIIPKYSLFTVIDVESGKSFNVQRRAGSRHADVQPLTREDTRIMKEIYDGNWSWRRRAVLILADENLIPASMHGMPHGAGSLPNGFCGHFCIHFMGSTTHRTGKADLSHYVMILKAAGKINEYMNNQPPSQLLNVLFVSIKNQDKGLVKKIAISNQKNIKKDLKKIKKIEAIQWTLPQPKETESSSLETEIPVEVNLFIKDKGRIRTKLSFTFVRTSPISPWKVNIDPLFSSIN
ncbi:MULTISPECIES: hypothetical protein [Bacillaceae]|uniref:hypothetical protein n=1 Tax=Bacillaceae TaxID=186817 RepID=UPI000BEB505D|nr:MULTISPECIES: hypothetical protein [unclassified Bacillus (in: firmicutes)]PEC48778.1 hypothetical protein CON00_14455 [Bacillus sp. AFS096315]PFM82797.1 hypothetical protein COJ46_03025 [Bacillus sp. AFS077874]